eukprot:5328897-Pyramimonas_sp.AAC.1
MLSFSREVPLTPGPWGLARTHKFTIAISELIKHIRTTHVVPCCITPCTPYCATALYESLRSDSIVHRTAHHDRIP